MTGPSERINDPIEWLTVIFNIPKIQFSVVEE